MNDDRPWDRERFAVERARLTPPANRVIESDDAMATRRDMRLRDLVRHARARSRWHRQRLASVDIDVLSGSDLSGLPTMSKADVMANWDEVVCDERLDLTRANDHLERVARDGPAFLDGRYVILASGGSSGVRGVFPWAAGDLCRHLAESSRFMAWHTAGAGVASPPRAAAVWGANAVHVGAVVAWLSGTEIRSAGSRIDALVGWLNELQPTSLGAYSSVLGRLAHAAIAGDLNIDLASVTAVAEPVDRALHGLVQRAFGIGLTNIYSLSEAPGIAFSFPGEEPLTLSEDLAIIEVVDDQHEPVADGTVGDRVLLTVLSNLTMPLIRYEVTDQLARLPRTASRRPWTGPLISAPVGRADDVLRWDGGIELHPHVVRSVLAQLPAIVEYQVRQTPRGIDIDAVTAHECDLSDATHHLRTELEHRGLTEATVTISAVPALDRLAGSAKLRRFVPLARP